ncbi:unnamed protein product, partial [Prorocentrum cordatum]
MNSHRRRREACRDSEQAARPRSEAHRRARRRTRRLAIRTGSPYAAEALREAAAAVGLEVHASAPCVWGDFSLLDWDGLLQDTGDVPSGCRFSCLYLRASLVRKAMLAHYLSKRGADASSVLPEGFVVDLEDESDVEDLRRKLERWPLPPAAPGAAGHPLWVAKASTANRGGS